MTKSTNLAEAEAIAPRRSPRPVRWIRSIEDRGSIVNTVWDRCSISGFSHFPS